MGGTQGNPPQPEDRLAPEPLITAEEFRQSFTEDMRNFLWEAINSHRLALVKKYLSGVGNNRAEAEILAHSAVWPGMHALQLIHALHPQPYTPIGDCPESTPPEVVNEDPDSLLTPKTDGHF